MLRVLSAPVLYALELTPACNNRCSGCLNVFGPAAHTQRDATAPPLVSEQWTTLLDILAPHVQRLKLTGGEPTLHPQFAEILQRVEQLGLESVVFTNGRWADPGSLLDLFAGARRLQGILVSLHGAHPASHDAFTGIDGSFAETAGNIKRAAGRHIPVTISTVLTSWNRDEIELLVELAECLGAPQIVFNRYLGSTASPAMLDADALVTVTQRISYLQRQGRPVKFGNCIPQCFIPNSSSGCLAGVAYCAIDPWGNLRPCTHSPLVAGNLMQQPLTEVWFSSAMTAFRASIPPDCHRCTAFRSCHGGCKALGTIDPLVRPGAARLSTTAAPVCLHPELHPVGRFTVRHEEWGLVLLCDNQVVPLHAAASPMLARLDGRSSLADIERHFGAPGLALIGRLYQKGMVAFM